MVMVIVPLLLAKTIGCWLASGQGNLDSGSFRKFDMSGLP
jgi:hypothetical protein